MPSHNFLFPVSLDDDDLIFTTAHRSHRRDFLNSARYTGMDRRTHKCFRISDLLADFDVSPLWQPMVCMERRCAGPWKYRRFLEQPSSRSHSLQYASRDYLDAVQRPPFLFHFKNLSFFPIRYFIKALDPKVMIWAVNVFSTDIELYPYKCIISQALFKIYCHGVNYFCVSTLFGSTHTDVLCIYKAFFRFFLQDPQKTCILLPMSPLHHERSG